MLTKAVLLVVALYVQNVCCSHYHGPSALPVVLHNGYLADTHDVAAAKRAHLTILSHQSQGGSYGHHGDLRYHGPIDIPHVLHDGHIADTHEVAAAKAEHFAAVAKARTHGGYHHGGDYSDHYAAASGVAHLGTHDSYHGPITIPHVLHDGQIADTHEVAATKAEHFAAVAKARTHGGYHHGGDYSGHYAGGYDHYSGVSGAHHGNGAHSSYHGPIAIPHVLHDGHIADTHEVAAAKAEHFAAVAKARTHGGYHHGGDYSDHYAAASGVAHLGTHDSYHGPIAIPHVLHDGHIADTHEVTAAKAEHFTAVAKARAHAGQHYARGYDHHSGASGVTHHGSGTHASYHGPIANLVVLPSGYLADTHEVTYAKQHHLQAVNKVDNKVYNHQY